MFETLILNRNGGVVDLRERRDAGRDLGEERVGDYSQDVLYERRMNYIYTYKYTYTMNKDITTKK